ncbi:CvpA family protein [Metabacillus fastidiosus]|uniref:CvpA family protein n=1 Tax=Metabacillus fastidiosus TaxID=1458 RepID=A0ABU6NVI7_9BACI|nr:CvpA family protein [Metabacillus fastidiosus]MED4401150.1 CvpA family protein [Metabacillus fastidiosus]MED4464077.1 CvpA family protein [Metabacillus fastidiosus]
MLDFILIIILAIGLFTGLKRGFILQLIHLTGFIIAFIVAYQFFDDLAPHMKLWIPYPMTGEGPIMLSLLTGDSLEDAFYRAISFVILFIGTKIVMHIIGSMLDFVALLPVLKQLNKWAGSVLGFLENYLIMFIMLFIAALIPIDQLQQTLDQSILANLIVNHTPYLSQAVNEIWLQFTR